MSYFFTSDSVWGRGHPVFITPSTHGMWGDGPRAQTSPCPEKARTRVRSSVPCAAPTPKDVSGAQNSSRGRGEGLHLQMPGYVERAQFVISWRMLEPLGFTNSTPCTYLCAPPVCTAPKASGAGGGATARRAVSALTQLPTRVQGQVSALGGSDRALTFITARV